MQRAVFVVDHPAGIDKTKEENPEIETTDQDLGKKLMTEIATLETVPITEMNEDFPQYPRQHQPPELITTEVFDPVVIIRTGKGQGNMVLVTKLGIEEHRIVGMTNTHIEVMR